MSRAILEIPDILGYSLSVSEVWALTYSVLFWGRAPVRLMLLLTVSRWPESAQESGRGLFGFLTTRTEIRTDGQRRTDALLCCPLNEYFFGWAALLADVCLFTPTSQMVVVSRVLDSHKILIISQNRFIWQLHTFCCFVGRSMFREKCSKISLIFNHCPGPPSSSSVSTTFAAAWWRQSVVSWAGGSVCAPSKRKSPKW